MLLNSKEKNATNLCLLCCLIISCRKCSYEIYNSKFFSFFFEKANTKKGQTIVHPPSNFKHLNFIFLLLRISLQLRSSLPMSKKYLHNQDVCFGTSNSRRVPIHLDPTMAYLLLLPSPSKDCLGLV